MKPDLNALVKEWQQKLRLQDWRITVSYVRDLTNSAGEPVYGLCNRLVDNKTATIKIRDPDTPAPTSAKTPSIEEIIVHELSHLLLAPLADNTPAGIAAEEQAVWAFSEAIMNATGQEPEVARAIVMAFVARNENPTDDPGVVARRRAEWAAKCAAFKQRQAAAAEADSMMTIEQFLTMLGTASPDQISQISALLSGDGSSASGASKGEPLPGDDQKNDSDMSSRPMRLPADQNAEMSRRMGIPLKGPLIRRVGNRVSFSAGGFLK